VGEKGPTPEGERMWGSYQKSNENWTNLISRNKQIKNDNLGGGGVVWGLGGENHTWEPEKVGGGN